MAHRIFTVACGIFSCDMQTLSCGMWTQLQPAGLEHPAACTQDLFLQPGIEPRPPALGARSLMYCTTREVLWRRLLRFVFVLNKPLWRLWIKIWGERAFLAVWVLKPSFSPFGFRFYLIELIRLSLRSLWAIFTFVEICKTKIPAFNSPKELVCHLNYIRRLIC